MNKKYIIVAAALLSFSHVLLPIAAFTAEQEQARLSTLWNLHTNNALTVAQFIENGHSVGTIIDRDIALLEKDMAQVLQQKASAEGFISNKMIPGVFKGVAIVSGAASVIGLISSAMGACVGYNAWNKQDSFQDKAALRILSETQGSFLEKLEYKFRYLTELSPNADYNQGALFSGGAAPFVAVASLLSAGISKYAFKKRSSWNVKNTDFIEEKQDQYNRDQAIIAQLKQIKYDNGL